VNPADGAAGQAWRPAVVATDLDGTIVGSDGTISARTRAALSLVEESGSWLVLATGRPQRWLGPIAEQTGHRGLAICSNGALLYDLHTETVLESQLLTPQQLSDLCRTLRRICPSLRSRSSTATGSRTNRTTRSGSRLPTTGPWS
jgi:HAD superfamily hydrolase (TIGR01484 family)